MESKSEDGCTINGTFYKLSPDCTDSITLGMNAVFCLDAAGKIAAVKSESNVSDGYAYLTNAYRNQSGDNVLIKITDKSGEKADLMLNDKIKLNGSSVTDDAALEALTSDGKAVKQLITYEKNSSDKITSINTADDNSEAGTANTERFTLNAKLEDAVYLSSTGKLGNIRISDSTIVFDISDESNIVITDKKVFENNQTYSGMIYDMSESFTAGVVVLTDTAFKANTSAPAAVVKKVAVGTDSDGDERDMVTLLVDGKEETLFAADIDTLKKSEGKITAGDVIQYKTDSEGRIAGIRVLLDINSKSDEFVSEKENDMQLVYGKVTKRFDGSVNISVNDEKEVNYNVSKDAKVYSVDSTKSKNNISVVSFDDITAYDEDENNRLFIRIYEDEVKELVIVK